MAQIILKALAEPLVETLRVSGLLGGETVDIAPRGLVSGGAELSVQAALVDGGVRLTFESGDHGEHYDVTLRLQSGADLIERVLTIIVIDDAWAMADGTPGWLSLIGFIDKFGFNETLAATDSDGSGIIDRRFLVNALRDAQAECAANIPAKYAQPLSAVPDILKTALADLARVRLYPRGVPDGLEGLARAQRQLLTRIASEAVALPGVAGLAISTDTISDAPIVFHSGGRAYPDGLADY
jgi:phage gp36-like protein